MRPEARHLRADQPEAPSSSRRSWLRFRVGYVVILAVIVLFTVKFVQQTWHDHERSLQLAALQAQLAAQKRSAATLAVEIRHDRTRGFVSQQARSLGYVKPGDRSILISYRYRTPRPREVRHTVRHTKPEPPYQQWWQAFAGGH